MLLIPGSPGSRVPFAFMSKNAAPETVAHGWLVVGKVDGCASRVEVTIGVTVGVMSEGVTGNVRVAVIGVTEPTFGSVSLAVGVPVVGELSEGSAKKAQAKHASSPIIATPKPSTSFMPGLGSEKFPRPDCIGGIFIYPESQDLTGFGDAAIEFIASIATNLSGLTITTAS